MLCLFSLLVVSGAVAAPKLSDAKIAPATAWIGDHVVVMVTAADPANEIAKLEAVVVEAPEITVPLNDKGQGDDKQAGDGIWSGGEDVPSEAFEGTYHIAIWPRDAAGKAFKVDSQFVKATVELTLKPAPPAPSAPTLSNAKIEPATAWIGDHVVVTVAVEDPGKQIAKMEGVVVEYPEVAAPLNDQGQGDDKQAGDGIWSGGTDVPQEAFEGTYHIAIWPRDAAGKAFKVDDKFVKATVEVVLKPPAAAPSADALHVAAAPWRTEAQIAKIKAIGRKPGEAFRFVVMGDSRSNPEVFAALLKLAAGFPKFDFSVDNGDIVPGGMPEEYAFFYNQIKDVTWPFLVVEGNHELGPSGGKLYEDLFGPTDYYFDHGGFRFVGLDNSRGVVTPTQLQWLREALTTDLRKVVFFHVPPAVIEKWAYHAFSSGAQELVDLLAEKKVERAYVGHIHGFGVADYKGVRYVLSGGAGAGLHEQIAPGNFHHIILVETLPQGLRETVYKVDGSSFVLDAEKWISGKGQ
jgi:hypothetical protein